MNFRYKSVYQLGLIILLLGAGWSVWASIQNETNKVAETITTPAIVSSPSAGMTAVGTNKLQALTFGLNRFDVLREHHLLGEPLWKYLASILYIMLAFLAARLIDLSINRWLKRLAAKTETKYDDLILDLIRGPIKAVTFVVLLNIGLGIFAWPERAAKGFAYALVIIVACSVTYVVIKLVDLSASIWRSKMVDSDDKQFAEQLIPLVTKTAKVIIIIVAALLTADNLNIEIKTLLAGLSVGGLALGLAAQDTVANLFGAVAVFIDKPFHIGDRIQVENVDGTVESIGLRSTRVRNLDGHHVTIPNKLMGSAVITNITRRPTIKTMMNIGLTYDTPSERVKHATTLLNDIFRSNPNTHDLIISFNKFADSSLNIMVIHFWRGTDAKQHFAEMQDLNLKVKERFDAEKLEFAFPTQTVYVKSDGNN